MLDCNLNSLSTTNPQPRIILLPSASFSSLIVLPVGGKGGRGKGVECANSLRAYHLLSFFAVTAMPYRHPVSVDVSIVGDSMEEVEKEDETDGLWCLTFTHCPPCLQAASPMEHGRGLWRRGGKTSAAATTNALTSHRRHHLSPLTLHLFFPPTPVIALFLRACVCVHARATERGERDKVPSHALAPLF